MLTGDGASGERRARALARTSRLQTALLGFGPARELLRRFVLPKPGEGPAPARARERPLRSAVHRRHGAGAAAARSGASGDRDPGYGSTCKLISESALCLAQDIDRAMTGGGIWTPGAAMGLALVRRLQERAGLSFAIEE